MSTRIITRNRKIKSCQYCYTHKLKCNRAVPCSTCSLLTEPMECVYEFDQKSIKRDIKKVKKSSTLKLEPPRWSMPKEDVYEAKYFYPFFTDSIKDTNVLRSYKNNSPRATTFSRNKTTEFNPFLSSTLSIEEILDLTLSTRNFALGKVDFYFLNIHPIIPIIAREDVLPRIKKVYDDIEGRSEVNPLDVLLIMSVLFCASYSEVASGTQNDLKETNRYYVAYRCLLDIVKFPLIPRLESLQACTVVNFIIDPNMTKAVGYSPMLVRIGQQLGLPKLRCNGKDKNREIIFLWQYILYIEGSSSVSSGLPFSTTDEVFHSAPLPNISQANLKDIPIPVEFSIGRFRINGSFREIMKSASKKIALPSENDLIEKKIRTLYEDILELTNALKSRLPDYAKYFSISLLIFLYRLHLRFYALEGLKAEDSSAVQNGGESKDVTWILEKKKHLRKEAIPLNLLLLSYTLKRIVQDGYDNLNWYTKGSTVMQYLFVILRDLYQNPDKEYHLGFFMEPCSSTIDDDIKEVINCSPLFYKYALVEKLLKLIEIKLAPLWSEKDLYKFILVKTVKEKVWNHNFQFIEENQSQTVELNKCKLFVLGHNMMTSKPNTFQSSLGNLEPEDIGLDAEKILMDWFIDFN